MLLIGNSFPLTLIRRPVRIEPVAMEVFLHSVRSVGPAAITSFWGHANSLPLVRDQLGLDLTPRTERPALDLTSDNLISFEGQVFTEVWIVSPQYVRNFRPQIGAEVTADNISGWCVLHMSWEQVSPDQ